MEKPFKLTLRVALWTQIFMILFSLPFTVGIIFILRDVIKGSSSISSYLFLLLFLACFAYMGWANAFSTIRITEKSVTVAVFYGLFRIHWDEVEKIMRRGALIALVGSGKRVVLSLAFAGKNKGKMIEFLNQQAEQRNIDFEKGAASFPITHENARVWW